MPEPEPKLLPNPDRYAVLKAFAAEWYPPLEPSDGYTEAEIAESEARLGFRLPATLRDLYLLAGKHKNMFSSRGGVTAPHDLEVTNGTMIIYDDGASDYKVIRQSDFMEADPMIFRIWIENGGNEGVTLQDVALSLAAESVTIMHRFSAIGVDTDFYDALHERRKQRSDISPGSPSDFKDPFDADDDPQPLMEHPASVNYIKSSCASHPIPTLAKDGFCIWGDVIFGGHYDTMFAAAKSDTALRDYCEHFSQLRWRISNVSRAPRAAPLPNAWPHERSTPAHENEEQIGEGFSQ